MTQRQTLEPARQSITNWILDMDHSRVEFSARHLMLTTVRGTIPIKSATIARDENDVGRSRIDAVLDAAGLLTGNQARDAHLRSADFLDVENHPEIRFSSTRIETTEDGHRLTGDLTIRGVTRPVVFDAEITGELTDDARVHRIGVTATTVIDRRDFGLTWNVALETGGVLVGDKVKVQLDLQGIRQ